MKKLILFGLLLFAPHLHAQTCTAASTSSAAVQTALNSCIAGGTVVIPAGSSTWSTTVSIAPTGPLKIVGNNACTGGCLAGSGGTSLAFTNNTNITLANASAGLQIGPCSTAAFCDVSEIHFLPTVAASNGAVQIQGTHGQVSFRVHHLQMDCSLGTGVDLFLYDGYGLVDHYLANDTSPAGTECTPINMGGDLPTAGAQNWTDTTNFGTNQSIILEDSNFASTNGGSTEGVFDAYYGAKVTLRHNTFTGFEIGGWHGTDSGGFRSAVLGEIYNNSITNSSGISMQVLNTRGGTLLFANNTVGGSTAWTPIDLQYFRVLGQNHSAQWGTGAAGLNWVPISATPTNALSDVVTLNAPDWQAGHAYTCSSGSPCLIGPLLHNAGTGVSGAGGYNYEATANCTSSGTEPNPWNQTFPAGAQSDGTCTWANIGGGTTAGPGGDGFLSTNPDTPCSSGGSCTRFLDATGGYPFRDQPGRVHDQVLAPNYAWSNTLPGSLSASTLMGTDSATASIIQSGTDFFNNTAMPSYATFTYPDPLQGTTWHIKHTGGTNAQCTGLSSAAYPGSGTGVACAYNHPFQMLTFSGAWTALAAGDTIEFDDPPTNTTPYFIGEQNAGVGTDWNAQLGGICGSPNTPSTGCVFPQFPNNVTIKGQNYGSCHNAFPGGLKFPTILSGINKVFYVLDVAGTNGMTVSCVEITQPDNCTDSGAGGAGACVSGTSNYIHGAGMFLNNGTSSQGPANMTLTDFAVVGTAGDGIEGSKLNLLSTDTFTASDVYVIGNGFNGWDGDSGGCGNGCESVGTMNITHLDAELNGCHVNLPYDWTKTPVANTFNYCYGQNSNGSGDNFVQLAAGTNFVLNMTHSLIKYGAQDGFDGAHISDDPTTNPATNVSTTWSEGNAGQQFKIGAGAASTLINNVGINTCEVLGTASNFPLNTSGWTVLDSGDLCRAGGGGMNLTSGAATTITVQNNTTVGYGDTTWVFTCSAFVTNCNGSTILFNNNLSLAFPLPSSGTFSAGGFLGTGITTANIPSPTHNLWFNMRTGCPDSVIGDTIAQCGDPLLVSESNVNAINPNLTSSSPAIANGLHIAGITTDFNGAIRPNPPAISAFQPLGTTPITTQFSGNVKLSGQVKIP